MGSRLVFLEGAEREAAAEASRREWLPKRDRADHLGYVRRLMDTDWGRTAWRVPALRNESGEVIASAFAFDLPFRLDHQRLRLGGLASVVVRPDLRRMGLGRFFVKSLEHVLREEGADGVMLWSPGRQPWLELMGWTELPLGAILADLRDWRTAGPEETARSVVRAYRDDDFEAVRNLFNTASSLQRFAMLRDDHYWRLELLRARLEGQLFAPDWGPWGFLVGERDGRVVSYLRTARDPRRRSLVVLECGFEPDATRDITAMMRFLLEKLGDSAPRVMYSVCPTRLANLCPSERLHWKRADDERLFMKSFGSFEVPVSLYQDERLVWPCTRI
jgi:GNAT superfamily N-acetyltransferase